MKCDRCGNKNSRHWFISWFNTDMLCPECRVKERKHPDYKRAKDVEFKEVLEGNMNYPRVGLPENYKEWAENYKLTEDEIKLIKQWSNK